MALSQHTLELPRLSSADLSVSITPPDATDQTVLWSASPEDVVSVEAGRVTGLKKGTAVVTAVSDTKSDGCTVTVTPAVYRHRDGPRRQRQHPRVGRRLPPTPSFPCP